MNSSNRAEYHPIFDTSSFSMTTPMVEELVKKILGWLWNGETGCLVLGSSRMGKTFAIRMALERLKNLLNEAIPTCYISIHRRDQPTITSLYQTICFSLGLEPKHRATSYQMADLVYHYLYELSQKTSTRQVVLFIDEFQRLSLKQLDAFAEIYDRMTEARVNICIIFIGNRASSEPLRESAKARINSHIHGRFFKNQYDYHGIRTKRELQKCLKAYDQMKFPEKNGRPYSKYFFSSVPKDWTLESCTDLIWDVYVRNYRNEYKLSSWPMQYFTAAIKILLVNYLPKYGLSDDVIIEATDKSIDGSGLVSGLVVQ